jgi:hypothetical protein
MTMSATLMMERQARQARVYWKKAADLESELAFTPEMKKIVDQYDAILRQAGG